jgi:cytochrome c-type biogenesis protein CcmH/NrfG
VAVGFWTAFAWERVMWKRSVLGRRAAAVALILVLLAFTWRVADRNPVWRDNATLFEVTLRDHPENFRAHWFQAVGAAEEGDTTASAEAWARARALFGSNSTFLTQYAIFQRSRGLTDEAAELVDEALRLRPASADAVLLLGLLDLDRGDTVRARLRVGELTVLGFPGMASTLSDSLALGRRESGGDFP